MRSIRIRVLESGMVKKILAWMFSHAPRLIPVAPVRETPNWMAFCHPSPAYPVHIVIIPKKPWKDWLAVDSENPDAMNEFVRITQSMIRDFELTPAGYRLIMNGGVNQTFPHLHFHLVSGDPYQ